MTSPEMNIHSRLSFKGASHISNRNWIWRQWKNETRVFYILAAEATEEEETLSQVLQEICRLSLKSTV